MKKERIVFFICLLAVIIYMNTKNVLPAAEENPILINVTGMVNDPQVIETDKSITIQEAIDKCGGFKENALTSSLNLEEVITSSRIVEILEKPKEKTITTSIYGEINDPGVYVLAAGSRVYDLINLAGGLTSRAKQNLDYAKTLTDEDAIYIEKNTDGVDVEDYLEVYIDGEVINPGLYKLKGGSILNDLIIEAGGLTELGTRNLNYAKELTNHSHIHIDRITFTLKKEYININEASVNLLETLTSIGEKKAKLIYDYAKENRFDSEQEIIDLLGDYVYQQIKDDITF